MLPLRKFPLFSPDDQGGGTGVVEAPAAAAPAATATPPAAPAAPAAPPTATPSTPAEPEDKPGDWNPKWRELMAGDDDKSLKQLSRYASPQEVWKKARALEQRLSSGDLKPILSAKATPEELAEYRKAHGIPEAPDKYDLKDVKIDDVDMPLVNKVLEAGHAAHLTPAQAKAVVGVWPEIKRQALEYQTQQDAEAKKTAEDTLRAEWGAEYRRNENLIEGLFDFAGSPELREKLLRGRTVDGVPMGADPDVKRFLLSLALINNPAGVVVPASSGDMSKGVNDRIGEIEKLMRENRTEYNKNEEVQAEYRRLLEAREAMAKR